MPRCLPILTPFFDRFLIGFCFQLGPPEPEKSSPRCSESTIFQKIVLRSWHRFLIDFGANMPPFSTKNRPATSQKSIPRGIIFSTDFCIDFSTMLLRFWRPTWLHVGHFFAQNTATLTDILVFFVGSVFFFGFLGVLAPSWRPLGSIWEGSGLNFGGF